MRVPAQRPKPRTSELASFPAPRDGWIANLNMAQPQAKKPDGTRVSGAAVLDNMFPTATGVRLMRGSELYATLGNGELPVLSLFSYVVGSQEQMFASTENAIYDITTVTTPNNVLLGTEEEDMIGTEDDDMIGVSSTENLDVVTGLAGGDWVSVQFATAGGTFLRLVNGTDTPLVYDGLAFDTLPLLTFAAPDDALDPSVLNYAWAYKQRLFFIIKDTLDAAYLPVDVIGGELTKLPLGGIFQMGGSLLFGASWSLDAGAQGGLSEQCIFVTTEGEVAVFQGANPSDANDWSKVGVYRIGRPLGKKAWIRDGGDLIIATSIGYVRLSEAIRRELAALGPTAVSYPIEVAWNEAVEKRGSNWHCEVWPSKQMAVIALPTEGEQPPAMFIANVRTGAWSRRLNWDGTCLLVFKERLFFGSENGKVVEANVSGLDQGEPYTGTCVPLFEDFGTPASLKVSELGRAVGLAPVPVNVQVSMQSDFFISLPPAPDALPVPVGNQWGNAIWGTSTWGGAPELRPRQEWVSVAGAGYALSPALQLTSGSVVASDYELVRIELTYSAADIVS